MTTVNGISQPCIQGHRLTPPALSSSPSLPLSAVINPRRLWRDIHYTAQWGSREDAEGMYRLSLSKDDAHVRSWFIEETKQLGCQIKVDGMGNIFAIYPGTSNMPPIGIGSHLDTQPAGGRYDGILGVLAGVEVIRAIKESGYRPYCSIAVVVWTNEEGAAFFPGCSGSSVWAGWVKLEDAYDQKHVTSGQRLEDALNLIHAKGDVAASSVETQLQAHFELHIEQGGLLEQHSQSIGVVRRIQGIRRYNITCHGRQEHAGVVKVPARADALVAASRVVLKIEDMARAFDTYATVGVLNIKSPSPNTIAAQVKMTVDARHEEEETLDLMEKQLYDFTQGLSDEKADWRFELERVWHSPALVFDEQVADCIEFTAAARYGTDQVRDMMSFAGHDSAMTALCVPTAMIFVPSRGGVSHSPLEYTSQEHCARGAQTVLDSVLRYDSLVRESRTKL